MKGGPLEDFEKFQKIFKMRFMNSVTAEKCKRGTLWDFLTSIVLQNIETNEEGPFGAIQKNFKKSRVVTKKI